MALGGFVAQWSTKMLSETGSEPQVEYVCNTVQERDFS